MKKETLIFLAVGLVIFSLAIFLPKEQTAVKIVKIEQLSNKIEKKLDVQRWYTPFQVSTGKKIFAKNCASCHGYNAEKTLDWKKILADGSYPPPPLNDKAHAWHHPYSQMSRIINNGGSSYEGKMPAFKDSLSQDEIDATIAYFQSFWADKYYGYWLERGGK